MAIKVLKRGLKKNKKYYPKELEKDGETEAVNPEDFKQVPVSAQLKDNYDLLHGLLGQNSDVVLRSFYLGMNRKNPAFIVYIENMVDKTQLNNNILKPLMFESSEADPGSIGTSLYDKVINAMLAVSNVVKTRQMKDVVADVLSGGIILIIDGLDEAFIVDIRLHKQRNITEPENEVLVRGPREGFLETLRDNIVLIRRRIKSPDLMFENNPWPQCTFLI